jgi:Cation transport protein
MGAWKLFIDGWGFIKALKPAFLSKTPHFNFITIHCKSFQTLCAHRGVLIFCSDFWIMGLTIFGSILLYPMGNLAYIDALFFASGACTQSGLNTVDINNLSTYQQLVLFLLPMLTNPISINTFVVFIRLYWFEKRFQHIVKEARRNRRTISKSRSQANGEKDIGKEEQGVNGREIVVLHHTTPENGTADNSDSKYAGGQDKVLGVPSDKSCEDSERGDRYTRYPKGDRAIGNDEEPPDNHPQIKFAEMVKRSDGLNEELPQLPLGRMDRDHIAVLERQRNPQDKGVLRIPGPRDSEMGMAPETVDEEDAIKRVDSRRGSAYDSYYRSPPRSQLVDRDDDQAQKRNITISEPHRRISEHAEENTRAAAHTLGVVKFRKPRLLTGGQLHNEDNHPPDSRPRRRSFSSINTNELTPYLSWQPTVGRNSAFVNLSESQREELGGIEYRSLKSLALILVLYFWGFTVLGFICLIPWIYAVDSYGSIIDADDQNRAWWGFFTTTSSFNDVGFTLTPDSMMSFQAAVWPLLFMSFLIIIGNTGFPIMLRWIILTASKLVPQGSGIWEELKFLLDHPRRCFTLLFPSTATWWLFWILVILNGMDLVFFIILDVSAFLTSIETEF